jgi:hypothetical protein
MSRENKVWIAKVKECVEWELADLRDPKLSTVYVLQCEETSRFKIGITQNLKQRFKEIQTTCPTRLRVIFSFYTISQEVERYLHRVFERYRLHGEWFAIPNYKMGLINSLRIDLQMRLGAPDDDWMDVDTRKSLYAAALRTDCSENAFEPCTIQKFWSIYGSKAYECLIAERPNENQ